MFNRRKKIKILQIVDDDGEDINVHYFVPDKWKAFRKEAKSYWTEKSQVLGKLKNPVVKKRGNAKSYRFADLDKE